MPEKDSRESLQIVRQKSESDLIRLDPGLPHTLSISHKFSLENLNETPRSKLRGILRAEMLSQQAAGN